MEFLAHFRTQGKAYILVFTELFRLEIGGFQKKLKKKLKVGHFRSIYERTPQEYKVKGIPNSILKILQERVKTNFGAFGYYFPQIYDCSLL